MEVLNMQDKVIYDKEARLITNRLKRLIKQYDIIRKEVRKMKKDLRDKNKVRVKEKEFDMKILEHLRKNIL